MLGDIEYPEDDGASLAHAIRTGAATIFSDGTVDVVCGAHAYTVCTSDDDDASAISGAAPTYGDPPTISSLRTEHFGAFAGLIWTWILVKNLTSKTV